MRQGSPGAVLQVKLASNVDDFCFGKIEYLEPGWEIAVFNPRWKLGHGVYLSPHGRQDRAPFCGIEIWSLDYLLLLLLRAGVKDDGITVITPYADDPRVVPGAHGGEDLARGVGLEAAETFQALPARLRGR